MAQGSYPQKKNKPDSLEVRFILALLRGIIWLIVSPFKFLKKKEVVKQRRSAALDTKDIMQRWNDIQTTVGLGGVTHFGSAIVSADKLLDHVLRQKGYAGETMGERLKSAVNDISPAVYHNAWQAHKLRNQLVHEVESQVLSFQAKEALQYYESVLRELGALR